MEKKILIFILLLIGNGIVNAVEYPPEYSFAPSYNECFVVDDYESELVGSAEHPVPVDPPTTNFLSSKYWSWYNSEGGQDWVRIHGSPWGIIAPPDEDWPSYVDPEYWEEFLNEYPEYYDEIKKYFDNPEHSNDPNNPFRLSLIDDTAGILILVIGGIAYLIYKFKFKKNEDFKN